MIFNFFFKKKSKQIHVGDVVKVKKTFSQKFPTITRDNILTVENILSDTAVVIFMNDKGNNIFREKIPLIALAKVG